MGASIFMSKAPHYRIWEMKKHFAQNEEKQIRKEKVKNVQEIFNVLAMQDGRLLSRQQGKHISWEITIGSNVTHSDNWSTERWVDLNVPNI